MWSRLFPQILTQGVIHNMGKIINENIIQIKDLSATVKLNNGDTLVTVNNANMELKRGYSYAVTGKSGSGKTSLISIIGLLNRSYKGEYCYNGTSVSSLTDRQLSMLRANNIGFVFQNYSLIKHLRVWENIELPLLYAKKILDKRQRKEMIQSLLKSVGLEEKENDYLSSSLISFICARRNFFCSKNSFIIGFYQFCNFRNRGDFAVSIRFFVGTFSSDMVFFSVA